jgi:hypothetical protein
VEYLKKNDIHMQKDENPNFKIKIWVENNTEIKSIENELRSKLQSAVTYPIYSLKQSFDANVIHFISTDPSRLVSPLCAPLSRWSISSHATFTTSFSPTNQTLSLFPF